MKVPNVKYIWIDNLDYNNNIKIYYNKKLIDFEILSNQENILKIDLKINYMCEELMFLIEGASNYKVSLYSSDQEYIISKEVKDEKLLVVDKSWLKKDTVWINYTTTENLDTTNFTKLVREYDKCRYREKYVYRYQKEREYYDDNYHVEVEGYIKDEKDYRYFYVGQPIQNTIEIVKEKIVKVPKIEFVYIEKEPNKQEVDSSKENECNPKIKTEIKTKFIEKEILKTPLTIYILLFVLTLIIIILFIRLLKKMSFK